MDFKYSESLTVRLVPFLRKEAAETEVEIEQVSSEEDNDDEEDQEAWPSGSSDDDIPIRFPRVKLWFKCPICLSNMYEHKNNVLFYINNFIAKEMGSSDVVKKHR
jgi:hypothetical protein